MLRRLLLAFLALACLWPMTASAQDIMDRQLPSYNLQRWRPGPMPGDYLSSFGSMIDPETWRLTGGFYLNWARDPMSVARTDSPNPRSVLINQLYADVFASLSLFGWAELSAVMPFALYQDTFFSESRYPISVLHKKSALSDMRVLLKGKILDLKDYPMGLALIVDMAMPTGSKDRLASDGSFGVSALAALEFNPISKVRVGVNLGYRYRPMRDVYNSIMGQAILLSAAASIPFFHKDLDLLIDAAGEITIEPSNKTLDARERPFEMELGMRYRILDSEAWWRGLAVTAAIGTGINAVGVPDVRIIVGLNFHWVNGGMLNLDYDAGGYLTAIEPCPDPELTPPSQIPERCRNIQLDSDGDTIPDKDDKCPFSGRVGFIDAFGCSPDSDGDTVPDYEDLCPNEGGRVDRTGCPIRDTDSDGDTIVDRVDDCPKEPETFNGIDDEDGCPDQDPDALVELTADKINIKEQVFFETGKAVIKSESHKLLNQVAKLLVDNPHVGNVTIEGHTDSRGKYDYNKRLSQERAESVMKYLIDRGVPSQRLTAIGYGPDRPIDSNDTSEGRARNRRVDFVVLGLNKE